MQGSEGAGEVFLVGVFVGEEDAFEGVENTDALSRKKLEGGQARKKGEKGFITIYHC